MKRGRGLGTPPRAPSHGWGVPRSAWPIVALLALWEGLPRLGWLDPLFVPPLTRVVGAAWELQALGLLGPSTLVSLQRAAGGFGLGVAAALPLGFVLGGWFPRVTAGVEPLLGLFAQANPLLLFHVVILFLGIGEAAKLFIIAWLCLWPVTFSVLQGLRDVDPVLVKAARSLGLGKLALFGRVVLPSAAPSILTGVRLSAGYAFLMLVAAEMMGASSGLGWLVIQNQESYHAPRIFACAAVVTLMSAAADRLLRVLQRRLLAWQPAGEERFETLWN